MWKDFLYYTKTERQGIIVLVVLIIGVFSIPRLVQLFSTPQEVTPEEDEKFKLEYDEFISSIKEIKPQRSGSLYSIRTLPIPLLLYHWDCLRG